MLAVLVGALSLFAAAPAAAQTTVWSGTLTVQDITDLGCTNTSSGKECSSTSVLTDDDFTHDGVNYAITNLFIRLSLTGSSLALTFDKAVPSGLQSYATLHVGSAQFHFANDLANAETTLRWDNTGLSWSVGDTVSLSITIPTVTLSASPNPVWEGSSVTVTATLSRALSSNVTIPLTLTDNSAEPDDHGTLASITINSGSTSGTGTISTNHDADDVDETFTVSLGTLPPEVTAGTQSSVQITIRDDEGLMLSVEATPPCDSTVTNTSVQPTLSLVLTPTPATETETEYRWVTESGEEGTWLGALSISPRSGRSVIPRDNTFAQLRNAYPGFEGFEYRLKDNTDVTAECFWTFDPGDTGGTPTNQPPPDTGGTGTGGGGGGGGLPTPSTDEDEEPQTSCPREDREILGSFYEMTDGESWHEKENWNSEEPLDQWHGVETEDGNVVSLSLSENNLSGDMPTKELLCLELKELALWGNDDLSGEVPEELVLAVERAVLRDIAEMLNINPEWFESYEDPYDFEDWHEGVTTDDDGRVTELDLTGEGVIEEIPESVSELQRLRDIKRTTSEGGCALSPEGSSAFGLFLLTLLVFVALVRKRARQD